MKALTVRQPFATRLVNGEKRIENRPKPIRYRGRVAIHAGKQIHDLYLGETIRGVYNLPRAAVVGTVEIVDCHQAEYGCTTDGVDCSALGGFTPRDGETLHHWVVANPVEWIHPLTEVNGALGLWDLPIEETDHD